MNYYGFTSGTPHLWFNGTHEIGGAGDAAATGEEYMDIIRSRYFNPAPVRVDIVFDSGTGNTAATVKMYSSTFTITDQEIHLILIEDDVNTAPATYDDTHIARAAYSETFSLSGQDNTAIFNHTFTIDPSWDVSKLRVIAIVQQTDHEVLQVGSSDPLPDFSVRGMVPFTQTTIGAPTGTFESDDITIMNVGLGDTFTIDLVVDQAPDGWSANFKDADGTTHTHLYTFSMTAEEQTTFKAVITPGDSGYMKYHLVIDSTDPSHLAKPLEIPFVYITDDVDALVIDDDGGEAFEDYFTSAMDDSGLSYGVWNRGADTLTPQVADTFDVLVWNVGWSFPSLDDDDKLFLADYLDAGKGLLLSGQDIGWELNDPQGAPDPTWYETYLHATYVRDDTGIHLLDGVSGDPVSDGISIEIEGGDGANNQDYPDEITAADADATEILFYQGDGCGAVRSLDSTSGARVVYLGFGFEAVNDAQDRQDLLSAAIAWIGPRVFRDDFENGDVSAWAD